MTDFKGVYNKDRSIVAITCRPTGYPVNNCTTINAAFHLFNRQADCFLL